MRPLAILLALAACSSSPGATADPVRVIEIDMPTDVLAEIATTGETGAFFAGAGRTFDIPETGDINGFYVREAAGVNGFTPSPAGCSSSSTSRPSTIAESQAMRSAISSGCITSPSTRLA
jgi:hypothetical protein